MKKIFSRLAKGCAVTVIVGLLLAGCLFLLLKKGIDINRLHLGSIQVEQLHLRLDKRLDATIGQLIITPRHRVQKGLAAVAEVGKAMSYFDFAVRCFQSITINKITMGDTRASFNLNDKGSGSLIVKNPGYSLETALAYSGSSLTLYIQRFESSVFQSSASGTIRMDTRGKRLTGDIALDLARTLPLTLHLDGNRHQLSFEGKGTAPIKDIRPVVELFDLGPDIQPWITDAAKGSSFKLDVIKGTIPFAKPADVFRTLYGKASVRDCEYRFEKKLPRIKAHQVDVVFENEILKIYPHQTTYAGVDAGRSWLDIDFSTNEPILTAFIRTRTGLGDAILSLLDFYTIHLPFKQVEGVMDGDLTLSINLETESVNADGRFYVNSGSFLYDKTVYTVTKATVLLHDEEVRVKHLEVGYRDLVKMQMSGKLDFSTKNEVLNIAVDKFNLPLDLTGLSLDQSKRKWFLHYSRHADIETLSSTASDWKIGTVPVEVQAFTASVKADGLSGTLSDVAIDASPVTRVRVSGDFNLKNPACLLAADFQGWNANGLQLDQKNLPIKITYKDGFEIASEKKSDWRLKGKKLQLSPFAMRYSQQRLTVVRAGVQLEDFLTASLHGDFDWSTGEGSVTFDRLDIDNHDPDLPDFSFENIAAELTVTTGTLAANVPALGVTYQRQDPSHWAVQFADLRKLVDHSVFLKKYDLNRGSVDIRQAGGTALLFSGTITYPYALLVKDNKPVGVFAFRGQYEKGNLFATINNDLQLHYADRMQISSNDIGYNFTAIRAWIEDHFNGGSLDANATIPDFDLLAENSSLYINQYQSAPADRIQIHADNGTLTGQLRYGRGKAEVEMNTQSFTLLGQDFGEKFLDSILKDSTFSGGNLSFYVSGLLTKFKGVLKIDNSVMKNGIILNNIMAFISTVPDLITFSLPAYSLQGMPFNKLYAGFIYDHHNIDVSTFAVESNALDMRGAGNINLVKNSIKMKIDLISKTKKFISKIPLIGYILVGDTKQPTVTLNVEGRLDDPQVSTSVYKEIVKTPFDILFRTISLPSRLLDKLNEPDKEAGAQKKAPQAVTTPNP